MLPRNRRLRKRFILCMVGKRELLMTTMIAEIYDALREAGVSEEKARQAAVALAQAIPPDVEARLRAIEAKITMLQWVIGLNFAATIAVLVKVFS